jgi:hypothetical protein
MGIMLTTFQSQQHFLASPFLVTCSCCNSQCAFVLLDHLARQLEFGIVFMILQAIIYVFICSIFIFQFLFVFYSICCEIEFKYVLGRQKYSISTCDDKERQIC